MERRQFLNRALALTVLSLKWPAGLAAEARKASGCVVTELEKLSRPPGGGFFPITAQVSPLPNGTGWKDVALPQARESLDELIDQLVAHGFRGVEYPFHLPVDLESYVLEQIRSRGLFITYNHTFDKGGVENFGRNKPPVISVYSQEYSATVRKNLAPVLEKAAQLPGLFNMFCYQDEPFHASPQAFDMGAEARQEFRKKYGYEMPLSVEDARNSPKEWLDLVNFQSSTFPDGWRQVYKIAKEAEPRVKIVFTHDSHSTMGAGVNSDSKVAVDDAFYWGADFADTFVFDIYPYMMFDYRYGQFGKLRKPRLSQMHFAFAQLRNLTRTYKKELGFWFGTFNREWFKNFMGPELRTKNWAEVEICYTAVGQGADFLISGYKIPEDSEHWNNLGKGLDVIQKAGSNLLDCPKMKAKACFVFPRTQYVQLQEEYWNVAVAYELFLRAFGELDCLHEEQIEDASLHGYEVLVLFDIQLLPEAIAKRIAAFVEAGGTVIADCVPTLDACRRPMDGMAELFGVRDAQRGRVKRGGVWVPALNHPKWAFNLVPDNDEDVVVGEIINGAAFEEDYEFRAISPNSCQVTTGEVLLQGTKDGTATPALIRKKSGKGQTFLFGFNMQDTYFETWKTGDAASRSSLMRLLRAITRTAGVTPHVFSSNPDIEACLRANQERAYVFVINHEAEDAKTGVRIADLAFPVKKIINMTECNEVEFRRTGQAIAFDIVAPRERPQLLQLVSA